MHRIPAGPAISISAPRQSKAGGVSALNAAQHLLPPGATWQRSPSFLIQKPHDLRHCSDWLYQRQRVSRQMLPPIVPMLRITGEAMVPAASVADTLRRSGRHTFCQVQFLLVIALAQRCQHALGSEWHFAQANAAGIVDRVGNRWNSGGQRTLARFLGAEGTFRIDALHDE